MINGQDNYNMHAPFEMIAIASWYFSFEAFIYGICILVILLAEKLSEE